MTDEERAQRVLHGMAPMFGCFSGRQIRKFDPDNLSAQQLLKAAFAGVCEQAEAALAEAQAENARLREALDGLELKYRTKLWAAHACPFSARYGDDGEMQCGGFDFKREPLECCEKHCDVAAETALICALAGGPR